MMLKPIQFGNVTIDFPVVLAPMAGWTDAAFRSICKEHGAGACYTEVTSAEGIRRDSQKTFQLLRVSEMDHPIAGHIFGKSVDAMVEAAQYIEQLGCFDWIDINCGCPVRKVVRRGAGAALMKEPEEIGAIVRAVKKAVSLPVTVKTRIGFSPGFPDHLTIAKIVEDAGADMIAVHGRLACNFHKGDADLEKLGEIKQVLRIPVIGNGGVFSPKDAAEMVRVSGVDGIMIGRGAVGNPWLFEQIRNPDAGLPSLAKRREIIETHLLRLVELNEAAAPQRKNKYPPEHAACLTFRPHLAQYLKGLRGRRELMQHLNEMLDVKTVMDAADSVLERNVDATFSSRSSCIEKRDEDVAPTEENYD
jgi:tRNA-dihydrouridine synthase B